LLRALRFFSPAPIHELPIAAMKTLVRDLLSANTYDLVISASTMMAPYAFLAQNTARYLEEHNFGTLWSWERFHAQSGPLSRLRARASWLKQLGHDRRVLRRFDGWSMVSGMDRDSVRRFMPGFEGKIAVIPNGVDCSENPFRDDEGPTGQLVFNGSLTYGENYRAMQYFLQEVYPEIRRKDGGVRLRITGSLEGVDLGGLALSESVELTGYLEDVRPAVAGATVAVAPILGGGGTRIKILEAMALGTPVVATAKGAEGLDVVHGTHLLLADAPADFARQVKRLLQDGELRRRVRLEARRLVERRYDWSKIGRAFLDSCEETVADYRRKRLPAA
jgi:polysaccharide biosynthesis protein PslH